MQDAVVNDMKRCKLQPRVDILGKKPEDISGFLHTPLAEGICIYFHSDSSSDRNCAFCSGVIPLKGFESIGRNFIVCSSSYP